MKFNIFHHDSLLVLASAGLLLLCSCSSLVQVTVVKPGEFKLGGVSKIAIVRFNSLADDNSVGIYSADEKTIEMAQSMVASVFEAGKTYKVTNLANENAIAEAEGDGKVALQGTLSNRFDALVYGRVWWQISPEEHGLAPRKYQLERWRNIKYQATSKNLLTGEEKLVEKVAHVTESTSEVAVAEPWRHWTASLMLSLCIYRLDAQGQVTKLVETYSIASASCSLRNSSLSIGEPVLVGNTLESDNGHGKIQKDNGFAPMQRSVALPTDLEFQYKMLAMLTDDLVKKLTPHEMVIDVQYDFSDAKLKALLSNGAFLAGQEYAKFAFQEALHGKYGKNGQDKVLFREYEQILNMVDVAKAYADSSKLFKKATAENVEYLFAIALCEEGLGHFNDALCAYRLAFFAQPSYSSALGISRCLYAMDMEKRVKETQKSVKKASEKGELQ